MLERLVSRSRQPASALYAEASRTSAPIRSRFSPMSVRVCPADQHCSSHGTPKRRARTDPRSGLDNDSSMSNRIVLARFTRTDLRSLLPGPSASGPASLMTPSLVTASKLVRRRAWPGQWLRLDVDLKDVVGGPEPHLDHWATGASPDHVRGRLGPGAPDELHARSWRGGTQCGSRRRQGRSSGPATRLTRSYQNRRGCARDLHSKLD